MRASVSGRVISRVIGSSQSKKGVLSPHPTLRTVRRSNTGVTLHVDRGQDHPKHLRNRHDLAWGHRLYSPQD